MPTVEHGKFLNQLPSDWEIVPISALGEVHAGSTPRRSNQKYWNGTIAWVTPGELTQLNGKWLSETADQITEAGLESCSTNLMPPGAILVTTRATIGNIAISTIPITTNQGFKSIVPDGTADPEFYYYMLQLIIPEMQRLASGSTFNEISGRNFASIFVPRPPIAEQRRIADILDKIDAAIQQTEAVIAKLKQVKAGLLHDLLTRGLDENGQLRDPEAHPEQFKETEIGLVPKTWSTSTLGQCAEISSGSTPNRGNKAYWDGGTIPWVKTGEINYQIIQDTGEKITAEALQNSSVRLYPAGTLLMAMYGQGVTRGKVAMLGIEATTNQACAAIVPDESSVLPDFLFHLLSYRYDDVRKLSHGSNQTNLSIKLLASFTVELPPLDEQKKITHAVVAHNARMDAEDAYLRKLHQIKRGLMQDLLTGRVRV